MVERARQKVDKEAADAHKAHCRIVATIRRCAKWMASLQARDLWPEMFPGQSRARAPRRTPDVQELIYGQSPYGQSPAPALGPARVQELIHQAKERGQKVAGAGGEREG